MHESVEGQIECKKHIKSRKRDALGCCSGQTYWTRSVPGKYKISESLMAPLPFQLLLFFLLLLFLIGFFYLFLTFFFNLCLAIYLLHPRSFLVLSLVAPMPLIRAKEHFQRLYQFNFLKCSNLLQSYLQY